MQKTVNLAARPVLCGFCPDLTLRLDTQCCFTCMFVCLYGGKPLFSLAPAHFLPARIFISFLAIISNMKQENYSWINEKYYCNSCLKLLQHLGNYKSIYLKLLGYSFFQAILHFMPGIHVKYLKSVQLLADFPKRASILM